MLDAMLHTGLGGVSTGLVCNQEDAPSLSALAQLGFCRTGAISVHGHPDAAMPTGRKIQGTAGADGAEGQILYALDASFPTSHSGLTFDQQRDAGAMIGALTRCLNEPAAAAYSAGLFLHNW